jgi:hypothetical protein
VILTVLITLVYYSFIFKEVFMSKFVPVASASPAQSTLKLLKQALAIQEKHYGIMHRALVNTLLDLSDVYSALEEPRHEQQVLERALAIQKKYCGNTSVEVAETSVRLSMVYQKFGRFSQASELLENARPFLEEYCGLDHAATESALTFLNTASQNLNQQPQPITSENSSVDVTDSKKDRITQIKEVFSILENMVDSISGSSERVTSIASSTIAPYSALFSTKHQMTQSLDDQSLNQFTQSYQQISLGT